MDRTPSTLWRAVHTRKDIFRSYYLQQPDILTALKLASARIMMPPCTACDRLANPLPPAQAKKARDLDLATGLCISAIRPSDTGTARMRQSPASQRALLLRKPWHDAENDDMAPCQRGATARAGTTLHTVREGVLGEKPEQCRIRPLPRRYHGDMSRRYRLFSAHQEAQMAFSLAARRKPAQSIDGKKVGKTTRTTPAQPCISWP